MAGIGGGFDIDFQTSKAKTSAAAIDALFLKMERRALASGKAMDKAFLFKVDRANRNLKSVSDGYKKLEDAARKAESQLRRTATQSSRVRAPRLAASPAGGGFGGGRDGSRFLAAGRRGLAVGAAALGASFGVGELIKANVAMEKIQATLIAVTGSAEAASLSFEKIRSRADELGIFLPNAAGGFARLAAAARGTSLEGAEVENIFEAITLAGRVFNQSQEQLTGTIFAFEQIISKGRVTAEELRRQLADRLPGSFQIAARAVGLTTVQLDNMLKSGLLISEEFLPLLAAQLKFELGPALESAATQSAAQIGRIQTAFFNFFVNIAELKDTNIVREFLTELAEDLENVAGSVPVAFEAIDRISGKFESFADSVGSAVTQLNLLIDALGRLPGGVDLPEIPTTVPESVPRAIGEFIPQIAGVRRIKEFGGFILDSFLGEGALEDIRKDLERASQEEFLKNAIGFNAPQIAPPPKSFEPEPGSALALLKERIQASNALLESGGGKGGKGGGRAKVDPFLSSEASIKREIADNLRLIEVLDQGAEAIRRVKVENEALAALERGRVAPDSDRGKAFLEEAFAADKLKKVSEDHSDAQKERARIDKEALGVINDFKTPQQALLDREKELNALLPVIAERLGSEARATTILAAAKQDARAATLDQIRANAELARQQAEESELASIDNRVVRGFRRAAQEAGALEERLERVGETTFGALSDGLTDAFTDPLNAGQALLDLLGQIQEVLTRELIVNPLLQELSKAIRPEKDPLQAALEEFRAEDAALSLGLDTAAITSASVATTANTTAQGANTVALGLLTAALGAKSGVDAGVGVFNTPIPGLGVPFPDGTAPGDDKTREATNANSNAEQGLLQEIVNVSNSGFLGMIQALGLSKGVDALAEGIGVALNAVASGFTAGVRATAPSEGGGADGGGSIFATGGSFRVGGSGGTDSQLVRFRASPNERVTIETPEQVRRREAGSGGSTNNLTFHQSFPVTVGAGADPKMVRLAGRSVRQQAAIATKEALEHIERGR